MMWCDTCHAHNETPVVAPGLGGCRDGSGTEGGTSHNRRDNGGGEGSEGGAGDSVVRVATATAMGEGSCGEVRAKSHKARVMAASMRWRLHSNSGR